MKQTTKTFIYQYLQYEDGFKKRQFIGNLPTHA